MAIKISKNRVDMGSTPIKNVSYLDVDQVATQAAPATGKTRFYSKTDGALYVVPAAGAETAVSSSIPANLIAHTTATTAPTGWAEYTAGRGLVIVGTPSGGTNGGTVGTPLTDLESPTHTHTGPSHTHENANNDAASYGSDTATVKNTGSGNLAIQASTGSFFHAGYTSTVGGTGATGATSAMMPYIQQLGIIKS